MVAKWRLLAVGSRTPFPQSSNRTLKLLILFQNAMLPLCRIRTALFGGDVAIIRIGRIVLY